jgi:O-acetyl-ADP-ribose deacetylase (regulator of RNase III)
MDTDKQASVDIGDLTLKVYQGDITEASVDVIVNGTNRDLDLTRGNCIYIYIF